MSVCQLYIDRALHFGDSTSGVAKVTHAAPRGPTSVILGRMDEEHNALKILRRGRVLLQLCHSGGGNMSTTEVEVFSAVNAFTRERGRLIHDRAGPARGGRRDWCHPHGFHQSVKCAIATELLERTFVIPVGPFGPIRSAWRSKLQEHGKDKIRTAPRLCFGLNYISNAVRSAYQRGETLRINSTFVRRAGGTQIRSRKRPAHPIETGNGAAAAGAAVGIAAGLTGGPVTAAVARPSELTPVVMPARMWANDRSHCR